MRCEKVVGDSVCKALEKYLGEFGSSSGGMGGGSEWGNGTWKWYIREISPP